MVTGKMVAIDRALKQVTLSSGDIVPYDQLILAPGLQVWPWYLHASRVTQTGFVAAPPCAAAGHQERATQRAGPQ